MYNVTIEWLLWSFNWGQLLQRLLNTRSRTCDNLFIAWSIEVQVMKLGQYTMYEPKITLCIKRKIICFEETSSTSHASCVIVFQRTTHWEVFFTPFYCSLMVNFIVLIISWYHLIIPVNVSKALKPFLCNYFTFKHNTNMFCFYSLIALPLN